MAVIGTYNGVDVIAFPSSPAPKQIQLAMNNKIAAPTNIYTGSNLQVQAWPGGDFWTAEIAMPKLRAGIEVGTWNAFLAECRGKLKAFLISDSSYKGPQGNALGLPLVDGVQSPMGFTLATRGWTASNLNLLLPGDYIQIGVVSTTPGATTAPRLYRVLSAVNSDADGKATISVWPSLREATVDGQTITVVNPVGLFRMAENVQSMTTDETLLGATSFKVVEAR